MPRVSDRGFHHGDDHGLTMTLISIIVMTMMIYLNLLEQEVSRVSDRGYHHDDDAGHGHGLGHVHGYYDSDDDDDDDCE